MSSLTVPLVLGCFVWSFRIFHQAWNPWIGGGIPYTRECRVPTKKKTQAYLHIHQHFIFQNPPNTSWDLLDVISESFAGTNSILRFSILDEFWKPWILGQISVTRCTPRHRLELLSLPLPKNRLNRSWPNHHHLFPYLIWIFLKQKGTPGV